MQEIINRILDKGDYIYREINGDGVLDFFPYDKSRAFSYRIDGEHVLRLAPGGFRDDLSLEEFFDEIN